MKTLFIFDSPVAKNVLPRNSFKRTEVCSGRQNSYAKTQCNRSTFTFSVLSVQYSIARPCTKWSAVGFRLRGLLGDGRGRAVHNGSLISPMGSALCPIYLEHSGSYCWSREVEHCINGVYLLEVRLNVICIMKHNSFRVRVQKQSRLSITEM